MVSAVIFIHSFYFLHFQIHFVKKKNIVKIEIIVRVENEIVVCSFIIIFEIRKKNHIFSNDLFPHFIAC